MTTRVTYAAGGFEDFEGKVEVAEGGALQFTNGLEVTLIAPAQWAKATYVKPKPASPAY
ncbi:hypothetical protein ACXYTP_23865 [Tsukamurella ocularis]